MKFISIGKPQRVERVERVERTAPPARPAKKPIPTPREKPILVPNWPTKKPERVPSNPR